MATDSSGGVLHSPALAPGRTGAEEVGTLISQAVHDLRSSLNGVQSWTYVLDRTLSDASGTTARALQGLKTGLQQHLLLIEHMRDAVGLLADDSPSNPQNIDLQEVVRQQVAALQAGTVDTGVTLVEAEECERTPGVFVIEGDAGRLTPLIRHLLMHCLWRARRGERVLVRLCSESEGLLLRITESHDEAVATERIRVLSEFFRRLAPGDGQTPGARQSTDLLLARRLVELQGARLTAEVSEQGADGNVCIAARFPRVAGGLAA